MRNIQSTRWLAAIAILAAVIALSSAAARAQEIRLRITAPSDGTIVHPGDAVSVSVSADFSIEKLALIGEHPLGPGVIVAGGAPGVVARGQGELRPLQFTLKIPIDIEPGAYRVTAIGANSSGETESAAISLQIEKSQPPQRIWAEPASIHFTRVGDQIPLRVLGAFADGTKPELTRSSNTTFSSADAHVATVNKEGMVTAVAPGNTTITATSGTLHYSVPLQVE